MTAREEQDRADIEELLKEHRQELEGILDALKRIYFQKSRYECFVVNYAARTMLTLPSVFANCLDAALDLDATRAAFGAQTAAEEGGNGRPDKVHPVLMMNALNAHGHACYGTDPIELKDLMLTVRLFHVATELGKVYEDRKVDLCVYLALKQA
ncbi:MAG TPA: hypothetical protein VG826_09955 [Pirellulales bacterium]|nr:hypothetical protein [Pirellulales bacterium]